MKIIVGLGNPGDRYADTRHNVGFAVLDRLAERLGVSFGRKKYSGIIAEGAFESERVLLVKPQTYMNNSGVCVARALRYQSAGPGDLLVVVDDVNLPLGKLRVRMKGSAGGHNGLKSIAQHLGSTDFARLRLGVGRRGGGDLTGHVLGSFGKRERAEVDRMVSDAAEAALVFVPDGIEKAMNAFNGT
ncbi:MAG: aminoacyl-tRNA hydrolase [Nitrospiraceae bacterium]|nr:aminoacyl-tRNA hydrolase [Nitrospiraceae bacterium]